MKTSSTSHPPPIRRSATGVAWRTAAIYAAVSAMWIFFSDHLLVALVTDPDRLAQIAIMKGLCFVALSALLIYALVSAQLKARDAAEAARLRTEAELDRQRLFVADVIEHSGSLLFSKDREGRYVLVNQAWLAVTNLTLDRALGRTDHELFPGAAGEQFRKNDLAVMASGASEIIEETLPGPGGARIFISVKFPTRAQSGEITGVCGMTTEVTARKRAEVALQRSEDQFRAMFEMASIGMAQADPATGQFLRVNRKLCELLGFSAEELLQKRFPDLTYEEDRKANWEAFQRAVRGEISEYRVEKRYVRKDGSIAWSNVNVAVARDAHGHPFHAMATIEDITARKEIEEALRSRERILESVSMAAQRFLSASLCQQTMTEVLTRLGEATQVSRVVVWEMHPGEDGAAAMSQRYEWAGPNLTSRAFDPTVQNLPIEASGFGRWAEILGHGEVIHGLVRDFPASEQAVLKHHCILSIAIVPIMVAEKWWGFIALDDCTTERTWRPDEIDALQIAGRILGEVIRRERSELALRESEERFRVLFEGISSVAIQGYTAEGTIQFWNPASEQLYGYTKEEAMGHDLCDLIIPPASRAMVAPLIRHSAATAETIPPGELTLQHKDGSPVEVYSSHAIVHLPGRPPELFCMDVDISARKRVEAAQLAQQQFQSMLLDSLADGVVACDAEGRLVLLNRIARDWHGLDVLDIPPSEWSRHYDLFLEDGVTPLPVDQVPLFRAFRGETVQNVGFVIAAKGHPPRHLSAAGGHFYDADHKLLGAVIVFSDVTARKQAEEALQKFAEDLRVQNETLNRFNKVTVGRELRMVELKHEVNELCERLSEKRRYRSEDAGLFVRKIPA